MPDGRSGRQRQLALAALWLVSTLPVLSRLVLGGTAWDLGVFMSGADALLSGRIYRATPFEYPPYAALWFVLPRLVSHDLPSFRLAFGLELWAVDAAIKGVLLWQAMQAGNRLRGLAPFIAYTLGGAAMGYVILQRFDLIPAALTLVAVLSLSAGAAWLAGVCVVIAAASKVYPVVLLPVFGMLVWRGDARQRMRFLIGVLGAALPLLLAAFWIPWWRFAAYHVERGLQVESLAASVVWALHYAGVPGGWEYVEASRSHEVTGWLASQIAWPARLLWVVTTVTAMTVATSAASRVDREGKGGGPPLVLVVCLALLPVTAFVATNIVLSPQFHLWLLPLAVLMFLPAGAEGQGGWLVPARRGALAIVVATLLVPVFYPHREFAAGLGPPRTAVLLGRNILLLYATFSLWSAARQIGKPRQR